MENIETQAPKLTQKEINQRDYDGRYRELKISNARNHVLKKQITEAYEILESIRFDHLHDSAFRDCITTSKRGIESALNDFLLSDEYWSKRIKEHRSLTPDEYRGKQIDDLKISVSKMESK